MWDADLLLQLVLPVVDGDGVVMSVQSVDESLGTEREEVRVISTTTKDYAPSLR